MTDGATLAAAPARGWPGLAVVVAVLGAVARLWPPLALNHDCGWYLHVAGEVCAGARPYVDVVDVNPPLIVYLNLLPVVLARGFGGSEPLTFELFVLALTACSIGLWHRASARRTVLLAVVGYLAIAYPRGDFGQREHLLVLAVVPYLALAAARLRGEDRPRSLALVIGALAGLGCALKPHYLLIALLVPVHAAWRGRRLAPLARAEHAGVLLAVVAYGLHTALLPGAVRAGFWHYLEIAWQTYGAYDEPLAALLREPLLLRAAALGAAGTVLLACSPQRCESVPLVFAWATALLAAVAQHKGWSYHFLPALSFGWLLALAGVCAQLQRRSARLAAAVVGLAVVAGALRILVDRAGSAGERQQQRAFARELSQRAAGGPILALDTQLAPYFPAVNAENLTWCSRFACLWPLPAITSADPTLAPSARTAIEAELAATILADIARRPPSLVIVRQPPLQACDDPTFDVRDWLRRQPELAAWWRDWTPAGGSGELLFYRRRR